MTMMTMMMAMLLNLIKRFDRYFERSISTFELGSCPSTDGGIGAEGDYIFVLQVRARSPSQDKILQTNLTVKRLDCCGKNY